MPKSRKRTNKKTKNVSAFHQRVLRQAPPHVIAKQLRQTMPWINALTEDEQSDALAELVDLTIEASGGSVAAATSLQTSTDYWMKIADLNIAEANT